VPSKKLRKNEQCDLEGRLAALRSVLRHKFGHLDAASEDRLDAATHADTERYALRLLIVDSLPAVFEDEDESCRSTRRTRSRGARRALGSRRRSPADRRSFVDPRRLTVAELFMEQGRAKGFAEGLTEGFNEGRGEGDAEGCWEILRSALLLRFQALDAATEARLEDAGRWEVDAYLQRLLTATSLAEVFEDEPGSAPRTKAGPRLRGGRH
jgi:hypothetical protein